MPFMTKDISNKNKKVKMRNRFSKKKIKKLQCYINDKETTVDLI